MTLTRRSCFLITFFIFCILSGKAQDVPIGAWDSHLPYNSALGLATDGNTVYTICREAFFTFNSITGQYTTYSKTDGMSDIGMQAVGYDAATHTAVLVYTNGNIDLFKDNTFYNIPDLKLKHSPSDKTVNGIFVDNGLAYLSTSIGIVVIDLLHQNIYKDYELTDATSYSNNLIPIYSFTRNGRYFYAVTSNGTYRADKDVLLLQNQAAWSRIDSTHQFTRVVTVNNTIFFANQNKVFTIQADSFSQVFSSLRDLRHIGGNGQDLLIGVWSAGGGAVKVMNTSFALTDSFECADSTLDAVQTLDGSAWVASPLNGLKKRTEPNKTDYYIPDGPTSAFCFDVYAYNRHVYIAHGGYNGLFFAYFSTNGFSNLYDGKWNYYKKKAYPPFDTTAMRDFVSVLRDEKTGTLYAGSYFDGLFALKDNGTYEIISKNSILGGSVAYGDNVHQIIGMTLDQDDNLWISEMFAIYQLYVKTKDGDYYRYVFPGINYGGPVTIDSLGQIWMVSASGGIGVYNTAGTLADTTDDKTYHLQAGTGFGNLPTNGVNCIARDKTNRMWIGTGSGLCFSEGCHAPFTPSAICDVTMPNITRGKYTGNLFSGKNIRTIAVDGVNRKWLGTDDGVWLLSADGQEVVARYTTDNSPLPSDHIQKITIDKVTGDIYFGTEAGLVSFHGTATDGGTANTDVVIFPNPIPSGYGGTIAIRGLVNNADVRITDINGQLVHHTTALGGQAIWNGMDYTGKRAASGVYLVFVTSANGKETYTGKLVFLQ